MSHKRTFKGKHWRVQLAVWDFSDTPVQWRGNWDGIVNFSVSRLKASASRSAAFSGKKNTLYYGPDFKYALRLVESHIGATPQLPPDWNKYRKAAA